MLLPIIDSINFNDKLTKLKVVDVNRFVEEILIRSVNLTWTINEINFNTFIKKSFSTDNFEL